MPTDILPSLVRSRARNVAVAGIAYSVFVFGLLKLGWVEQHAVLPFTQWQGRIAAAAVGAPSLPIDVTLACSGADAFALCAGAILAYPVAWPARLAGTAAGFGLIVALNSIRIGTLGRVAASPLLFEMLHVYIWPAILILAIAGYVFGWMKIVNARSPVVMGAPVVATSLQSTGAFAGWAALFVLLFVAASPLYLRSEAVLRVAAGIAHAAAGLLRAIGIDATATANVLWISKGGFEVTPECVATPLLPLYCAAVMAFATGWRSRLLGIAGAVPVFVALGIARLSVVALPAAVIGSPLFLVHAFYQIVLAACIVCAVVLWRGVVPAWRASVLACAGGLLAAWVVAPLYSGMLVGLGMTVPFDDAQGAMAALPSFQAGFYVALSLATMTAFAWPSFFKGLAALVVVQAAALTVLHAVAAAGALTPQIRDVRAWAIAAPLAIVMIGLVAHERPRH